MHYLAFILLLCCCSYNPVYTQNKFYPVSSSTINYQQKFNLNHNSNVKVQSFEVSELITVKEFKAYLNSVKKDSSKVFYANQLPHATNISSQFIQSILKNQELQNQPMPGVSWMVANNYCIWLEKKQNTTTSFRYTLPSINELIAFDDLYHTLPNEILASWVLENYDESFLFDGLSSVNHIPFVNSKAAPNDPLALKRKIVYGNSYYMSSPLSLNNSENFFRFANYEYMDSSSLYVGFRIIRKPTTPYADQSVEKPLNTINFQVVNNHLNGIYEEKYANGATKTIGTFLHNQRNGLWSIFDSLGNLQVQRNYHTNSIFEAIYPKTSNPYVVNQLRNYEVKAVRNPQNIYLYPYIEEREIAYSERLIRLLNKENEAEIFKKVDFSSLVGALLKPSTTWYHYGKSGDFKEKISPTTFDEIQQNYTTWDYSRIELKVDAIFSTNLLSFSERVVGVSFFKNTTDTKPSYTIYFPSERSTFAKFKWTSSTHPAVQHLDDYFFFKLYRGTITDIIKIGGATMTNDWETEINLLNHEHEIWLFYQR